MARNSGGLVTERWRMRSAALALGVTALWTAGGCGGDDEAAEESVDLDGDAGASSGWCEVQALLDAKCGDCHGDEPRYGAPMSLVTWDDLHAASPTADDVPVHDRVVARVKEEDSRKRMPQPPADPLSEDEIALLEAWVAAGAPGDGETCELREPQDVPDAGAPTETWPADCEERHTFLAHGEAEPGDETPFDASEVTDNHYQCFNFKVPWGSDAVQSLQFTPVIDDERVVHHWILYGVEDGPDLSDGELVDCEQVGERYFISGWAPGGGTESLREDIGFRMPSGDDAYLQLEVHYYNPGGSIEDASDRSGVELCTTRDFREHTAGVYTLGTVDIDLPPNSTVQTWGTCVPENSEPVHILSSSPHMHLMGTHQRTVIHRQDGSEEVLHDGEFSFDNQVSVETPAVIMPGDSLTTTCTFENSSDNRIGYGEGTDDEMCFNFVTAYPLDQMVNLSASTGPNRCIGFGDMAGQSSE